MTTKLVVGGVMCAIVFFVGIQYFQLRVTAQSRPVSVGNGWFKVEKVEVDGTCALVAYNASCSAEVSIAPCR